MTVEIPEEKNRQAYVQSTDQARVCGPMKDVKWKKRNVAFFQNINIMFYIINVQKAG
jgi:hypothetical protein